MRSEAKLRGVSRVIKRRRGSGGSGRPKRAGGRRAIFHFWVTLGGFQVRLELLRSGRRREALDLLGSLDPDRGWLARCSSIRALSALGQATEVQRLLRTSSDPSIQALTAAHTYHRHGWDSLAVGVAEGGLEMWRSTPLAACSSFGFDGPPESGSQASHRRRAVRGGATGAAAAPRHPPRGRIPTTRAPSSRSWKRWRLAGTRRERSSRQRPTSDSSGTSREWRLPESCGRWSSESGRSPVRSSPRSDVSHGSLSGGGPPSNPTIRG